MQPALMERRVEARGVLAEGTFGISVQDQAHILSILRDRLYTNKKLAVLREYATNAWDAHVEAGKSQVPIEITMPTIFEPSLKIRDFGPGLSEESVLDVYVKYGASTKRGTNEQVGMLGIGCKSAFAYSDSFTITSHHGGTKKVYVAVLDETNVGRVSKMHEEPSTETGVEILIPILPKDVQEFANEATVLYSFFNPRPKINQTLLQEIPNITEHGFIQREGIQGLDRWVAVMGCVPYRVKLQLMRKEIEAEGLETLIDRLHGGLYFRIGDVDVSANREELEYTDKTKAAVVRKLKILNDQMTKELEERVTALKEPWRQCLEIWRFTRETGCQAPQSLKDLHTRTVSGVELYGFDEDPKTKIKTRNAHHLHMGAFKVEYKGGRRSQKTLVLHENLSIPVRQETILVLNNMPGKPPGRFRIPGIDNEEVRALIRVVSPHGSSTLQQAEAELRDLVVKKGLEGIPIRKISEFHYEPTKGSEYQPKYSGRLFRLDQIDSNPSRPYSAYWEKEDHEILPGELYVFLYEFHCKYMGNFHAHKKLIEALGGAFPVIWGIRNVGSKKKLTEHDVAGTLYENWFHIEIQRLLKGRTDTVDIIEAHCWSALDHDNKAEEKWLKELDAQHPIAQMILSHRIGRQAYKKAPAKLASLVEDIKTHTTYQDPAKSAKAAILARYPLLDNCEHMWISNHWGRSTKFEWWLDYVRAIDVLNP